MTVLSQVALPLFVPRHTCSEVVAVFSPGPDPEKFSSSVHITVSLLLLQSQLNTAVVKICVAASFI